MKHKLILSLLGGLVLLGLYSLVVLPLSTVTEEVLLGAGIFFFIGVVVGVVAYYVIKSITD
jgi:hypothetical protein